MKNLKSLLLLIVAIGFAQPVTYAQNTSTQGKEFWLSFMQNGFKDHDSGGWVTTQILISAKRNCSGTVSNPLTGWSEDFTARPNSITTIEVPERQGYHGSNDYETVSERGIHILADDTISVYCTNIAHVSFDASFVLPIESLGDDYMIQTYDQSISPFANAYVTDNETSAFLIIATEDNTDIDITPTCNTLTGHPAGQTYTITLNAGQTYHVRSTLTGDQRDLSGTRVTASDCKKIAIFNGNTITCIPTGLSNGYDHVFEQDMPLRSWGKQFVVTTSLERDRDFIKITSSADNNEIYRDGHPLTTLEYGESHIFPINETEGSCFLQADYPCAVYLYNSSFHSPYPGMSGFGDPSMVWIAPVEQRINDVTFTTFNNSNINVTTHSVNIIVKSEDIDKVYLDGEQISPLLFSRVNGNNDYSYARRNISHGVHHLTCENGFNAHVYGFGDAKGYAYLVGSNAIDLSTNIIVNDVSMVAGDTYEYCSDQPVTFSAEVNYQDYTLLWDFGDGTTSSQNPVSHTYADRRVYHASLIVNSEATGCNTAAGDTTAFIIDASQKYITESDEICAGHHYTGHGFNNVLINNDTILACLQDNPVHPECKDSLLVYITAHPNYYVPISDSRCWQEGGGVYDAYGFSFLYTQPGTFERTLELETIDGCDSIVMLTLTVADRLTYEFSHLECNGSYTWDGRTYTEAGDYEWSYVTASGCDSIATLHLSMGTIKNMEFDTIVCGDFEWDGMEYTESGDYERTYTSIDGCDSIVICHLNISANVEGPTETVSNCDSYEWYGNSYTESGIYTQVFPTPLGCDSTIYLDLEINYSPDPTPIFPVDTTNVSPHWVISPTEFQINVYDFQLWDNNPLCHWDTVTWNFEQEVGWIAEPYGTHGRKCKIYVTQHVEDTIWLQAHVTNMCIEGQNATQRYWFVSSFYGIEEDDTSTDREAYVSVTPNPNSGQMSIRFCDIEGQVTASVYDMQGKAIDHFELSAAPKSAHSYAIKGSPNGIYLFVFNHNGHIFTQKVIITN